MTKPELQVQYTTRELDTVIRSFINSWGGRVEDADWFLDPVKGVVVFRLYVREKFNEPV